MKLGTRLFIAIAIPVAALVAIFAVLEDHANRLRSIDEVAREGRVIARTVQIATANALRDRQLADVRGLIDDISGHESILAVRLFDDSGRLSYASHNVAAPLPSPAEVRAALAGGGLVRDRYAVANGPVISWVAPVATPQGGTLGAVQVLQLESFVQEDAAASSRALAAFAICLVLALALVVFLVTRFTIAGPVGELVASARGIGDGEASARVPVRRDDELGRLAREFNRMCERLEHTRALVVREQEVRRRVEADLREAERLASIGRFAAGVAHEIGTPLGVIRMRAESLQRRTADTETHRGLGIVVAQIERIARIVRGMLDFARVPELRLAPTDLGDVVVGVVELVEERCRSQCIALALDVDDDLPPLAADADRLHQVFLNLAVNAADAMPRGGALRIDVGRGERTDPRTGVVRPCATVTFADTGEGIAPEHLPRVFEPFFSTKEIGAGTGLGLAVSYGIVQEHGGWIEVASERGSGTRITVSLPFDPTLRAAPVPAGVA